MCGTPQDGTPVETPPIGLAYYALVVAQHERRLDDVRQCGHLLVTEHPLEQRELTPAEFCISVTYTTVTIRPLRPLRDRYHQRKF